MYHCNLYLYFAGCPDSLIDGVKKSTAPESFTYEFSTDNDYTEKELAMADVIFAGLQGRNVQEIYSLVMSCKKEGAELIFLAEKEQLQALLECDLSETEDIWFLPMTEEELQFRFAGWQKHNKTKKDLWLAKNYLDSTINSVPHLIWYKDRKGAHLKVNESFCHAVNKTMDQIEGKGHYYIWDLTPDDYAKGEFICMESEYEVMDKRETCIFEEDVKIGNEMRKLETYKSPLFDLDGSVMGTVGVAVDVTRERLYEQTIINNANTDFLTKLYNRRYVYEFVEEHKNQPMTVYYLDLDNFKSVNDIYGHKEGDRALLITTEVLQASLPDDMIARIGGDEFMAIHIGECTSEEIETKRLWLQEQIEKAFMQHENFKGISASIGTAHSDDGSIDVDTLTSKADAFMYSEKKRKKKGRGMAEERE